ncbi:bifunctional demethylmenaquinone methyltransferase/2-methoxy-6-polyprenyl-1,4-benzoquinol methylase UbiE [Puteibacter caeruleilacunae]|nr:bifunctional demethylmenaquinone methyltransferase/2-methoxy-6-polyprenyl-1,4-benzoquinol methylase UbiE [Puteibacter caeruleilacunae]
MFDRIARHYDFLNHFLSLGIDRLWRKKAIRLIKPYKPLHVLDIATGTGDFAVEAIKLPGVTVTGVDISRGMLEKGIEKIEEKGLSARIELMYGDSEDLQFGAESYDAITAGFGVRNFENLEIGLAEMRRVLKPGGVVCILEFSRPTSFPMKQLYEFYFFKILPFFGKVVSKDDSAYTYLPESVYEFPDGEQFLDILRKIGFKNQQQHKLTGGIASIYMAEK